LPGAPDTDTILTRRMLAVLVDHYLHLFEVPIDQEGKVEFNHR